MNRTPKQPNPRDPLDPDFMPESRAASLWPESVRPAEGLSTQFGNTRFDAADAAGAGANSGARRPAAFDVCHAGVALRAVLLVQAIAAIGTLLVAEPQAWVRVQAAAGFAALAATLLWLVSVCALQLVAPRWSAGPRVAIAVALGAAYACLGVAPLWWAELLAPPAPTQVAGLALAGAAIAALFAAWLELRSRLWRPADASARLAELQSRIRPHFLFNALNTALALVRVDPDRAERVLEDLSALFREALADSAASVSLTDEIGLARRYLDIEQVRYGDRLQVEWDIDAAAGAARVPPLVLQPLVENAVRHGVEPSLDGGRVWIQTVRRRGHAVLLVRNTVPLEASRPGAGMAMVNVRERMRLLHDVGAQCDAWRGDDGLFHARIVIPL